MPGLCMVTPQPHLSLSKDCVSVASLSGPLSCGRRSWYASGLPVATRSLKVFGLFPGTPAIARPAQVSAHRARR